jgi:stearoyl-CoA desaturase (delta-9 desaturase)
MEKQAPAWGNIFSLIAVHSVALLAILPSNFSWYNVEITMFFYWITLGLGITLGYHRLVSHRSLETSKWLEYFLVFCGTLSCENGPITWVGLHRIHHRFSNQSSDPYNANNGFIWSHIGWLFFKTNTDLIPKYTKDIQHDSFYKKILAR